MRGPVDHLNIITEPARGNAINFPFKDARRNPIHADDIAEVFARVPRLVNDGRRDKGGPSLG